MIGSVLKFIVNNKTTLIGMLFKQKYPIELINNNYECFVLHGTKVADFFHLVMIAKFI